MHCASAPAYSGGKRISPLQLMQRAIKSPLSASSLYSFVKKGLSLSLSVFLSSRALRSSALACLCACSIALMPANAINSGCSLSNFDNFQSDIIGSVSPCEPSAEMKGAQT